MADEPFVQEPWDSPTYTCPWCRKTFKPTCGQKSRRKLSRYANNAAFCGRKCRSGFAGERTAQSKGCRVSTSSDVLAIKDMATRGVYDVEIADSLGLTEKQVKGLRHKHQIPSALPTGAKPLRLLWRRLGLRPASYGLPNAIRPQQLRIILSLLVGGPRSRLELGILNGSQTANLFTDLLRIGLVVRIDRRKRLRPGSGVSNGLPALYSLSTTALDMIANAPKQETQREEAAEGK